jgi:predicted DCC family thiol-disulfide oxidoreductase YuxK
LIVARTLRDHFLRIDARSLGFFRIVFGLVLVGDLLRRWTWLKEFYSNEGVLPNHNHLFNLHEQQPVWSVYHAFSSQGENRFAFAVTLLVYVLFLLGYKTRAFHALSLVCLVGLTGRNVLLENAGNYAAIAILAFTLFLPCGSRFSLDALGRSMHATDEKSAAELNDRSSPSFTQVLAARSPGWSPASLAAFAVLAQLAIIHLAAALNQKGSWLDGTALHYALQNHRFASGIGHALRTLPAGVLGAWTQALHYASWAIPVLIFVPGAPRITRGVACALTVFHGLSFAVLFHLGLYGWALVAAASLLVPAATWERASRPNAARRLSVIYDADCGVCLWLARLLKRFDLRGHVTFQGNDDLEGLNTRDAKGELRRISLPKEITSEMVLETVVVVDAAGNVFTRGRAVAAVIAALPLGLPVSWLLRVPGIAQLLDLFYDLVATRRQRISVLMGKEACGLPQPADDSAVDADAPSGAHAPDRAAPAIRVLRSVSGSFRELVVAVMFAAALAQTAKVNEFPRLLPESKVFDNVTGWPRMLARWDVLTPEPPRVDEIFVIDAQTRAGVSLDPLTGAEPSFDLDTRPAGDLGQLWNDYLDRIHRKEWSEFVRAFRDYLGKGGPRWEGKAGTNALAGYDAYWVTAPIPAPGEARDPNAVQREKLFTFSRGGRIGNQRPVQPQVNR